MSGPRLGAALCALALATPALTTPGWAQSLPGPKKPLRDEVGLLDAALQRELRTECARLERATSAELAVLIVGSTYGQEHHAWGTRVFNHWGVGKRGLNNGALLLFAMRDRRVELVVGDRYEELFTPRSANALLEETVVPLMRQGQPAQAVLAGVRAVSERIQAWEEGRGGAQPLEVEAPEFGGAGRSAAPPAPPAPAAQDAARRTLPAPPPARRVTTSTSQAFSLVPTGRSGLQFLGLLVLIGYGAFFWWALHIVFTTGRLVLGKGLLYLLALGGPLLIGLLLFVAFGQGHGQSLGGPDYVVGGGGVTGGLVVMALLGHICPRCRRYMSITSRTLRHATYTSSGTGERTYHCRHCSYHKVTTYTIPRRTRSTSSRSSYSSSSRSSGGRSSFGGGSSRGGGGGASW